MRRTVWCLVIAGSALGLAHGASAREPPVDPVRLEYQAPASCPSRAVFESKVVERGISLRSPGPGEQPRIFRVRVSADGSGFAGDLEISEPSGAGTRRVLVGIECGQLVDALALVVALAIDPRARTPEPEVEPEPEPEPELDVPQSVPTGSHPGFELGGAGVLFGGFAPATLYGGGITARLSLDEPASVLTPSVRVALFATSQRTFATEQGIAAFAWVGGELGLCAINLRLAHGVHARTCMTTELGQLSAEGRATENPRQRHELWLAAGVAPELQIELSSALAVQGYGSLVVPFQRGEFLLGPEVVHRTPASTWRAGIRLLVLLR